MKEIYFKIWLVLAPIVFGVSYFITNRIRLRMMQLAKNKMQVEGDDSGWYYALGVTVLFSVIYFFVARDLSKKEFD